MQLSSAAKVCAVFGYGKGIGAAVARKWSSEGYRVAIMARSMEKLSAAEQEIPNTKGFACDVTRPEAIDQTIEAIESSLGPVDVLVWNAGNGVWKVRVCALACGCVLEFVLVRLRDLVDCPSP